MRGTRYAVWLTWHPYHHCHSDEGKANTALCPEGHLKKPLYLLSVCLAVLMSVFFAIVV